MAPSTKITDLDLYEILEILPSASEKDVKKAYRKKALKCHPDKNPDNLKAAEEWETLSKALEILTSQEARAAYDKLLKARKASELRNRELESKRRKIKEDLESREAAYKNDTETAEDAFRKLEREIKRLREEGSQIVQQEQEFLRQQMKEEDKQTKDETPKLKVKWKSKKSDPSNGGYNTELLKKIFTRYGVVVNLVVSQKKNGSAIVEFASADDAELAIAHENGLPDNPFHLTWLSGKPTARVPDMPPPTNADDFENQVLERMRQAQRKKDLEESQPKDDPTEQPAFVPFPSATSSSIELNENFILEKLKTAQKLKDEKNSNSSSDSSSSGLFSNFGTGFSQSQDFLEAKKNLDENSKSARDFETLAMRKLRQAEERRKLIEQMEREGD